MRLRAMQMSLAEWLLLAAVLMVGTLGRTIRFSRPADGVTWRATPSTVAVQQAARAPHRANVAPTPSRRRSTVAEHAEERKAAAMLLLLMLGRDRFATVSR
jgi:hypothetical protein